MKHDTPIVRTVGMIPTKILHDAGFQFRQDDIHGTHRWIHEPGKVAGPVFDTYDQAVADVVDVISRHFKETTQWK